LCAIIVIFCPFYTFFCQLADVFNSFKESVSVFAGIFGLLIVFAPGGGFRPWCRGMASTVPDITLLGSPKVNPLAAITPGRGGVDNPSAGDLHWDGILVQYICDIIH
jgi:hypothetical protein